MTSNDISLQRIKGVGSTTEERIKETLDIETVGELLKKSKDELKEVEGIGEKKAEKILENAEELVGECERCGSPKAGKEKCADCSEELEEKLEDFEERLNEYSLPEETKDGFQESIEEIRDYGEEGDFEAGFATLEFTEENLEKSREFSELLPDIEEKKEKYSEIIDVPTYEDKIRSVKSLLKSRKFERGIKKSKQILENIEKEKELSEEDERTFKNKRINDFCRSVAGIRSLIGEKLSDEGLQTVGEVASLEPSELVESADLTEEEAEFLLKRIHELAGDIEFEKKEIEEEEEEVREEEDSKEEDEIFIEIGSPEEFEQRKKQQEEIIKTKRERRPEKEPPSGPPSKIPGAPDKKVTKKGKSVMKIGEDIYGEKSDEQEIEEKDIKIYWIPAIILLLIFITAGYLLFI